MYLDIARELRKLWNMRMTVKPIVIGALVKGVWRVGNYWTNGDHQNYNIVEIGQNTEKGAGDPRSLAVT